MSRARPIRFNGEKYWFDMNRNGETASAEQLELLALVEHKDLDELLDEVLTQGDIVKRLRIALGEAIPPSVLEERDRWREARQIQPCCRMCGKEGDSTKHHFVNRWILRELDSYTHKWANRSKNCIPVCIDCHRDLHERDNGDHSIADLLTNEEKQFADDALQALADERPTLLILIGRGDGSVYESRLVKDWMEGRFRVSEVEDSATSNNVAHLRVVA